MARYAKRARVFRGGRRGVPSAYRRNCVLVAMGGYEVRVITLPNCPKCEMLKQKLEREGVTFEAVLFAELPLADRRRLARRTQNGELEFPIVEDEQ